MQGAELNLNAESFKKQLLNLTDKEFTAFLKAKAEEILDIAVDKTLDDAVNLVMEETESVPSKEKEVSKDNQIDDEIEEQFCSSELQPRQTVGKAEVA